MSDKDCKELVQENQTLRRLLWSAHPCKGKYGDDGEMQCGECVIDFRRDEIEEIENKIQQRGLRVLEESLNSG